MPTNFGSFGVVKLKLWSFSWKLSDFSDVILRGLFRPENDLFGKGERRKVVDNSMNLNLKNKFAEFEVVLREIRLFKVRVGNCPATRNSRLRLKLDFLLYLAFELKFNEIKGQKSL